MRVDMWELLTPQASRQTTRIRRLAESVWDDEAILCCAVEVPFSIDIDIDIDNSLIDN